MPMPHGSNTAPALFFLILAPVAINTKYFNGGAIHYFLCISFINIAHFFRWMQMSAYGHRLHARLRIPVVASVRGWSAAFKSLLLQVQVQCSFFE
jgi:hypothetical protein